MFEWRIMHRIMPSERVQRRVDDLLDQAKRAVSDRDWATVQEIAEAVLIADSQNGDALVFIAMAQSALGLNTSVKPVARESSAELVDAVKPESFVDGRYEVRGLLTISVSRSSPSLFKMNRRWSFSPNAKSSTPKATLSANPSRARVRF